ncbi:hypothetical protein SDC9_142527 [bioreactor metagenome]|uniref:Uncharacterized protein n=1 Tax=bioreactor metagenome TaxID=1076179 RepID=A0A645E3I9_9ZZZZ
MRHRLGFRFAAERTRGAHGNGNRIPQIVQHLSDVVGHVLNRAVSGNGGNALYIELIGMREREQNREHVVMPWIAIDKNLHVVSLSFLASAIRGHGEENDAQQNANVWDDVDELAR